MCICSLLITVLYDLFIVLVKDCIYCFKEPVSPRELGKPSSRTELWSPNSLNFKTVERAKTGSALTGVKNLLKYLLTG